MDKNFKPTTWAINNTSTVFLIGFFLVVGGLMSYLSLPKEQFPEIVLPTVYVGTPYPGTSPTDMENLITRPIEKEIKSVVGVKKIKSNSIQDYSAVTVEFNSDIEPSIAKQRISDAVDKAMSELPTDLDQDPSVQEIDFSEFPIMFINISGPYDLDIIKSYAEDIEDKVEQLAEITRADMVGDLEKEIKVDVDIYKMQLAGVSFNDISNAIRNENINLSGGNLDVGKLERTLRVVGEFNSVNQIEDIIVKGSQGAAVYLRDIANISLTDADRESYARLNRDPVITLNIIKRSGENLISAADQIAVIIEDLKSNKFPDDLNVVITSDLSVNTKTSINELINSVVLGFLLVTIVLLFFMGVRNALFVGLAVPLSSALAFMIIPNFDFTFNIVVTFSFLLALGILVDNAIVVIENTYRLYTVEGKTRKEAARIAAGEVFSPVLAGTITTIAPFFPLLFWPGLMGEFMFFMPATLIIVLAASLFVAFILNPAFAVVFMQKPRKEEKAQQTKNPMFNMIIISVLGVLLGLIAHQYDNSVLGNLSFLFVAIWWFNKFILEPFMIEPFQKYVIPFGMNTYRNLIAWTLQGKRPWLPIIFTVFLLFAGIILTVLNPSKVEFFPSPDPNTANVYIELPIGTRAEVTDSITSVVEDKVFQIVKNDMDIVKSIQSNVGIGAGDPQNPDRTVKPHKGKVTVSFVEFGKRDGKSTNKVLTSIRNTIKGFPGTSMRVEPEQAGPPTGKPVNIEISGDDFDKLVDISENFRTYIIDSLRVEGIENLKSDLELNKPEIIVDINREKANKEGVSAMQIASTLRTALYGSDVSKYRLGEDDYDIVVRASEDYRTQIPSLMNLLISFREPTGSFREIPISSIADIRYDASYGGINRIGLKRVVTLSSNVLEEEGYNANEINAEIRAAAVNFEMPEGYEINLTGEQEDQKETTDFLGVAFGLSIGLVLIALMIMFNSLIKVGMILTTILFSIVGVLMGYASTGMDIIIVMTLVGIIALAGIVVNNGILLIEFIDEMKSRGKTMRQAILEGGSVRFTPVILTASSTMLGLIPLALGMNIDLYSFLENWDPQINFNGNDNTAFWSPLSWAIIFGLTFSTILTLIVVPAMYDIQYVFLLKYKFFRNRGDWVLQALFKIIFGKLPKLS
ncbi:efflux RND transporter permease subunit [Candidatus Kapabacteria bacterium]|nr:efflux RND transporter permease subunit [Candidatus Kapabacteria bacterium]